MSSLRRIIFLLNRRCREASFFIFPWALVMGLKLALSPSLLLLVWGRQEWGAAAQQSKTERCRRYVDRAAGAPPGGGGGKLSPEQLLHRRCWPKNRGQWCLELWTLPGQSVCLPAPKLNYVLPLQHGARGKQRVVSAAAG